jgi:pyrroloquinoline quinone (PQQ) biosynthesis protein C
MPRDPKATGVVRELDTILDEFMNNTRYFQEPYNLGRAQTFVLQHRQNTRYRNSVLKLKVATNCPDWNTRLRIIGASAEEIIADDEFGGGLPHWQILENLGVAMGMSRAKIRAATPLKTTQLAWNAWTGLMDSKHWLLGLVANVVAERANISGYGKGGLLKKHGWFGHERARWKEVTGLPDDKLGFFKLHEAADEIHSDLGWKAVAEQAKKLRMEDEVLEAARQNLAVWELYLNGIGDAGDELNKQLKREARGSRRKAA